MVGAADGDAVITGTADGDNAGTEGVRVGDSDGDSDEPTIDVGVSDNDGSSDFDDGDGAADRVSSLAAEGDDEDGDGDGDDMGVNTCVVGDTDDVCTFLGDCVGDID